MTMKKMYFYINFGTELFIVPALSVLAHQLAVCSRLLFYSQGEFESLIWKISKLLIQHHTLVQWNAHPGPSIFFFLTKARKGITKVLKKIAFFLECFDKLFH